jgi:hypothetical protein
MICPFAVWKPVPSHSGPVAAHYGLVVHVQVGTGSCYPEFSNTANQASSTWWIGQDGTLEQYVDTDNTAWTEMAGNYYYNSVETEGVPTDPFTDAQCATLTRLIGWGHETLGWPLVLVDHGGVGITTHAHYPSGQPDPAWGGHPCPGPVRAGQLPAIVAAAAGPAPTPKPTPLKELPMQFICHTELETQRAFLYDGERKDGPVSGVLSPDAVTNIVAATNVPVIAMTAADIASLAQGFNGVPS